MKRTLGALVALCVAGFASASRAQEPVAGNTPPVAAIRAPVDGSLFSVGQTLSLVSAAVDAEEPAGALRYRWSVDLVHGAGIEHDFFVSAEPNAFFAVEDLDELEGIRLDVRLVVTDGSGASDTAFAKVEPKRDLEPKYPLGTSDVLEVTFYAGGTKQEEFTAEVSAQGTITTPLIGETSVGGLSASETSDKLTMILARDFFVNPQVLVKVREHAKKVYVGGEVKEPGAVSIREGTSVLTACILAGGFTEYAALNRVTVTRTVGKQTRILKIDLREVQKGKVSDLTLETGDRIDVPHRVF